MSKQIECIDCGNEFEFTDGEEAFYAEKGLFPPKRCKKCRSKKRAEKDNNPGSFKKGFSQGSKTYKRY